MNILPDSEVDNSPWSSSLEPSDRHLVMCMSYSRANEVVPFVERLAATHGLVCWNPQSGIVKWPPHIEAMPHLRLTMENGQVIDSPGPSTIASAISSLAQPANGFAILARSDLEYMQTVIDDSGRWVIEFRDGSPAEHYELSQPVKRETVENAFADYASGNDDGWRKLPWKKLNLE